MALTKAVLPTFSIFVCLMMIELAVLAILGARLIFCGLLHLDRGPVPHSTCTPHPLMGGQGTERSKEGRGLRGASSKQELLGEEAEQGWGLKAEHRRSGGREGG